MPASNPPVKAVFFDLDDTLSDHHHCCRSALHTLAQTHAAFQPIHVDELLQLHERLADEIHPQILQGQISLYEGRIERFRRMLLYCGADVTRTLAEEAALGYRRAYLEARRPIAGSLELLQALRPHVHIVIITNNMTDEQQDKIRVCGFGPWIDAMITSESAGVSKPAPAIFEQALKLVNCSPQEVVMIGDSWSADVIGAYQLGIRAIWLNRHQRSCPDPQLATELHEYTPLEMVLPLVLPHL